MLIVCVIFLHDIRNYYFTSGIANTWNSLPNYVNIWSIDVFKSRLDKF